MASSSEEFAAITKEVIADVAKGVRFNRAFSWAAHRRGIYHADNRGQYNLFFREVLRCFKKEDRKALKKALEGPREWQHGKITRGPKRPQPPNTVGRTRLKPGIEVEADECPYLLL